MKYYSILLFSIIGNCFAGDDDIFANDFEVLVCSSEILLTEDFNVSNQQGWGGMWEESGTSIDVLEIINNQGRLVPLASSSPYSLARIFHPLDNAINSEVTFAFVFENASSQGVGMYLRSNGGHLTNTNPTGQGYAVFIERFSGNVSRFGLWYEIDGIEEPIIRQELMPSGMPYNFLDEVIYHVRFQVFQEDIANTRLRAKIWQNGNNEPAGWDISESDEHPPLQNTTGAVAVDSFHSQSSGLISQGIRVDDIVVSNLCLPL